MLTSFLDCVMLYLAVVLSLSRCKPCQQKSVWNFCRPIPPSRLPSNFCGLCQLAGIYLQMFSPTGQPSWRRIWKMRRLFCETRKISLSRCCVWYVSVCPRSIRAWRSSGDDCCGKKPSHALKIYGTKWKSAVCLGSSKVQNIYGSA